MDNALLMSVPPATTIQKDHAPHPNKNLHQDEMAQIKSAMSSISVNSSSNSLSAMSDPHHRTMLHILEQLLDLKGVPLSIQSLYENIYSPNNTQQPIICVNNAEGLRRFLARYPSLFRLEGDFVHAAVDDSGVTVGNASSNGSVIGMTEDGSSSRHTNGSVSNRGVKLRPRRIDICTETEAVKYFQTRLMSKPDRWVQIRSLAGHLSQASSSIREAVGPQARFREFISRHPVVFEVQGELVGLRNRFSHMCINRPLSMVMSPSAAPSTASNCSSSTSSKSRNNNNSGKVKLRSGNSNKTENKRPTSMVIMDDYKRASTSEDILGSYGYNFNGYNNSENNIQYNRNSISPEEFQAALYLRSILQKQTSTSTDQSKPSSMDLATLFIHLARAPPAIRDCIGWTRIELEQFIRKMPTLFEISLPGSNNNQSNSDIDDSVNPPNWCVRPINQSFNLLESAITTPVANQNNAFFGNTSPVSMATESMPITPVQQSTPVTRGARTIVNHQGCVYHVTKLWGIIDLGQHEHVFFDISIFKHLDNLEKYFKIGETVYFNAILAPKQSRAKWRATQLWKETDNDIVKHLCNDLLTPLFNSNNPATTNITSNHHHHHHQAPRFQSNVSGENNGRDDMLEDDDLVSLYSPSVLLEQQVVLDNQRNIDNELAEILQMTKVNGYYDNDDDDEDEGEFEDFDEDDEHVHNHKNAQLNRNNTNNSNNNDSTSILSCSTDISSSASGIFQNSNGGGSGGCPLSLQDQSTNYKEANSPTNQSTIIRHCCGNKKMVEMSTQTLSTGEIMSVAMYHD